MWQLDHKKSWAQKNWCFWTVVLEKTLESPLDCKEIKPANLEGNQSWIFIGRPAAEGEIPILRPPDAKSQFIGKDPDAGKDWRQDRKGMTEDEMVGWHHWLNGQEFDLALGDGEGQGNLACCSPWGRKELDTTEWLNGMTMPYQVLLRLHLTHTIACLCAKPLQSCLTLRNPMDCSSPTVHGILQERIQDWDAFSFSRGSFQPRDQTRVFLSLMHWQVGSLPPAPPGKPLIASPYKSDQ